MEKHVTTHHPDIDGGWAWVILLAAFLTHVIYGVVWSTGVYNVIFLKEFGEAKSVTAWAGSLPCAVLLAVGPISSMLTNKCGCRATMVFGGLMSFAGLSASFFAQTLYFLYFTFGILTGVGFGLSYIPVVTAISYYFKKKLTFAVGISCCGMGFGNFLYPPLIRWLISTYDWRQSFLILGAIALHICFLGCLIRPINRTDTETKVTVLDFSPLRKKSYLMLCINNFLFYTGISSVYIHVTAYAEGKGVLPDNSAWLISVVGLSNLVARVAYGVFAQLDCINTIILYTVSFFLAGVCVIVTPFINNFQGLLALMVSFGFLHGCWGTLLTPILVQLLGLHRFANGYGCLLLFDAAGQLLGGPLAGWLFDITGSYSASFFTGGALCIASSLTMVYTYIYVRRHPTFPGEIVVPEKEITTEDKTLL